VRLRVARLEDGLPPGLFDLVASALAVHPLDAIQKADLFRRVAAALEPVQRRIQRGDVKGDRAAGPRVDEFGDLVAVAVALLQQGENQHFGAALPQSALGHRRRLDVRFAHMSKRKKGARARGPDPAGV